MSVFRPWVSSRQFLVCSSLKIVSVSGEESTWGYDVTRGSPMWSCRPNGIIVDIGETEWWHVEVRFVLACMCVCDLQSAEARERNQGSSWFSLVWLDKRTSLYGLYAKVSWLLIFDTVDWFFFSFCKKKIEFPLKNLIFVKFKVCQILNVLNFICNWNIWILWFWQ